MTTVAPTEAKTRRPIIITIVCIIGCIIFVIAAVTLLSLQILYPSLPVDIQAELQILFFSPAWLIVYTWFNIFLSLLGLIGFWYMRRWAVLLFVGLTITDILATTFSEKWEYESIESFILPLITIIIGFAYFKRMR